MTTLFDVAIQMGRINRWAGRGAFPLSIAQHQTVLSYYVPPYLARAAHIHDISETLIGGDVIHPVKMQCPELIEIENRYLKRIFDIFEVPFEHLELVTPYDFQIRDDERRVLWPHEHAKAYGLGALFEPMLPLEATNAWLERYYALFQNDLPDMGALQ